MVRKDYYHVLGLPREASERRIQQAFRRLAKEHHPDRVGPESTARFQEIAEAYEVLSDPEKRRDYDANLSARAAAWSAAPPPRRRHRVEPLVPEPLSGPGLWVEELFAPRAGLVEGPWPRRGPYELLLWLRLRGG